MDLRNQQIKDTYGNLITVGTVAGTPTTGTLQNGAGSNVTALTLAGDLTATNVSATSLTGTLATAAQTNITSVGTLTGLSVSGTTALQGAVTINESGADVDFRVEGDTDQNLLRIDAGNDRVGIGTSSPSQKLSVQSALTTSASDLFVEINCGHEAASGSDFTGEAGILFKHNGSGDVLRNGGEIVSVRDNLYNTDTAADSSLVFKPANNAVNTERMRITYDGNVGIGATTKLNVYGSAFTSLFLHTGTGDVCPILEFAGNRSASAGNQNAMIQFWNKTGTATEVGRITSSQGSAATQGAVQIATKGSGSLATVTTFTSDGYIRMASGTGGIQFGGDTAAANALDDYEEGTWTPTYTTTGTDYTSVTYNSITSGRYTKIGNKVFIEAILRTDAITVGSASGTAAIAGLPFSTTSATPRAIYHIGVSADFAGDVPSSGRSGGSSTLINLFYRTSANGATIPLNYDDLDTGSNKNDIFISGYYTV